MLFKWNKVKYILTTARQYATRSKRWTPEESKKLVAMVKKHGRQWNKLHPMFPDRTITALMSRYSLLLSAANGENEEKTVRIVRRKWNRWTAEEDRLLLKLFEEHGQQWSIIAGHFDNRTSSDILQRFNRLKCKESRTNNMGQWSADEIKKLDILYKRYGENWTVIAANMGTRNADQCRHRYRYELQHEKFLEENKSKLEELVKIHGTDNFSKVVQALNEPRVEYHHVSNYYWSELDPKIKKGDWAESEVAQMLALYKELDGAMELVQPRLPIKRGLKDMWDQYRKHMENKTSSQNKEAEVNKE